MDGNLIPTILVSLALWRLISVLTEAAFDIATMLWREAVRMHRTNSEQAAGLRKGPSPENCSSMGSDGGVDNPIVGATGEGVEATSSPVDACASQSKGAH